VEARFICGKCVFFCSNEEPNLLVVTAAKLCSHSRGTKAKKKKKVAWHGGEHVVQNLQSDRVLCDVDG
jgi:hypothetical protein